MRTVRSLLAATCVAVFLAVPAQAHDVGLLHVHRDGVLHVPAFVWGIASLAVAATLLRRRRRSSGARARA